MYIYIYIIYIYIYIYNTNLPVNAIVRLPHPQRGDSQGQKTFLAPSADKQTRNHDIECSNHHPSLSTVRPKGLSRSKMKWWAIYTSLPVNAIVRLSYPRSGDSQGQETFVALSAGMQTRNIYIYICMYVHVYVQYIYVCTCIMYINVNVYI